MEEERNQSIHLLMVALAAQGHMNPMLRFGKRLQSKGLHVTLATPEVARHRMLKHNCSSPSSTSITETSATSTTTPIDSISGINLLFFSDGLSLDYDRRKNLDNYMDLLSKFGPVSLKNSIKHLYHQREFPRLSCIIGNPFVPWAADVAVELGVPGALLWIQPCSLLSVYYHFVNKITDFPTSENTKASVKIPGIPLLDYADLPSFVLPSNYFGSISKLILQLLENIKKFKWVLANSCYELEKDAIDGISELIPIKPVGPLVPPTVLGENQSNDARIDMWKPEDKCIEWLNQRPESSVIYVAFGSLTVLSKTQMENVANALRNSKLSFIWVVKPPEYPAHEGAGQVPEGFMEETKEQGLVVGWCEQNLVLSHPSIACFLSHCGWNSILEAVGSGVPVIGFPQWNDQPTNAKLLIEVFGVGVRLWPKQDGVVSSEEVEKCIGEVVSGPKAAEFREKAAEWKRIVRVAVADGGSSDRNIQWFVNEVTEVLSANENH
ncbi:hypothetical protein Ancab_028358 [Ancistrocladus abbreviatus]